MSGLFAWDGAYLGHHLQTLDAHPTRGLGAAAPQAPEALAAQVGLLGLPGCASETLRWGWHLRLPHATRFVALGSALAAGALPPRSSGLGVAWWANAEGAELSLLWLEGGVFRELLHLPTPLHMDKAAWAGALSRLALHPQEVAWWVGSQASTGAPPGGLGLFQQAKQRWVPARRAVEGLAALHAGRWGLVPCLGGHRHLKHPMLRPQKLLAHAHRPARLTPQWRQNPWPLGPVYLYSQGPTEASGDAQAWWWCALAVASEGDCPRAAPWVFSDNGLPVAAHPVKRLPGEGVWLRCEGGAEADAMRAWLLAVPEDPQEALRRAHLGAHALWPVAEEGRTKWPEVHRAWAQLMQGR